MAAPVVVTSRFGDELEAANGARTTSRKKGGAPRWETADGETPSLRRYTVSQ